MDLLSQILIDRVVARMKLINGAGDYYLNIGERVYDHRDTQYDKKELPAINVEDGEENPEDEFVTNGPNRWDRNAFIDIKLVSNGVLTAQEIRKGIADIQHAVGTDLYWGGIALTTYWRGTVKQKDQEEIKVMSATVRIRVKYRTNAWQKGIE